MDGYKNLHAWQHASKLCLSALQAVDEHWTPRAKVVFEQLARAAVSADVNIVEGYALGTIGLYRRHLRISLGSAAEAQRLLAIARSRRYLPDSLADQLESVAAETVRTLYGLVRSKKLSVRH